MEGLPRKVITVSPTVTASSAYTAGNCVGGLQTLLNANGALGFPTRLDCVSVIDKGNQKAELSLLFFSSDPTSSSLATPATVADRTAFAWGTSGSLFVGKFDIASADYETVASVGIASDRNIWLTMLPALRTLYVAVVTTGTPTYTAASNLTFLYGFEQS